MSSSFLSLLLQDKSEKFGDFNQIKKKINLSKNCQALWSLLAGKRLLKEKSFFLF